MGWRGKRIAASREHGSAGAVAFGEEAAAKESRRSCNASSRAWLAIWLGSLSGRSCPSVCLYAVCSAFNAFA